MYRAVISVKLAATPFRQEISCLLYSASMGNEKGGDRYVLVVQRCHDALGCLAMFVTTVTGWTWW